MATMSWWEGATPHQDIRDGKVNETLFAANLAQAVQGQGPEEYCRAEAFFAKTFLTRGLRELLIDVLRTLAGQKGQNPVANLQTSFGGGKTHSELAIYHLLEHPDEALRVPQVRQLVAEAGLDAPPACQVAVLACSHLNPLGRTTADGVTIRTLWGEMAYRLGGKTAFDLIAENDARMVSPGEGALAELLDRIVKEKGSCAILFDETLHYVDKVTTTEGAEGSLAKQTVAFLRELTVAVDTVPQTMLVVSLTASRMDQISPEGRDWLERMDKHVNRLASARTPIEGTEIHEIVRQRLFQRVDEDVARQVAQRYHRLYANVSGLPGQITGATYRQLMERSYPFHPELVTILYERWGSKSSFQLTRGTLRFLALMLQDLWRNQRSGDPDLILPGQVRLDDSDLRALVREVAGDPQWESVIGSDIAASPGSQPAKAELIDRERGDNKRVAQALATTVLLYSLGGGENPLAALHELRLASSRPDDEEAVWQDALDKFKRRLFYFYVEEDKYQFRKEPNVLSLQHTYRTNLQDAPDIDAHLVRVMREKALGEGSPSHGFRVHFQPEDSGVVPDDDSLHLVVLGLDHVVQSDELDGHSREAMLNILQYHGQPFRNCRNTVVFCVADAPGARRARTLACDFLGWRKIQTTPSDWDRIGGAQQAIVSEQMEETQSGSYSALISAYKWAFVPTEDARGQLGLQKVQLGAYGPGKLVAPMVWETLTADHRGAQHILTSLTAETLLQRYGAQAWPTSQSWITTAQLWERFTRQVALPMLSSRNVLLDTLRLGQLEGLFAIGHLLDEDSPRDQRDSYLGLFCKEALPPNAPEIGQRWLVLRPAMYQQIEAQPAQVSKEEVAAAIQELNGNDQPVSVGAVYKYVKAQKRDSIDDASFHVALATVAKEHGVVFRLDQQGADLQLPESPEHAMQGYVVTRKASPPPPPEGRMITIQGVVGSLSEIASLYKNVLQPLSSQRPTEFTIQMQIKARFDKDPGGAFDAVLEEGFRQSDFPGLMLGDSKRE